MDEIPGLTFRVNNVDGCVEDVTINIGHFNPGRCMLTADLCKEMTRHSAHNLIQSGCG